MDNSNVTPLVPKEKNNDENTSVVSSLSPREIVSELDRYVVGQNKAKRAVAIALRNRWRRQALKGEMKDEVLPKNIMKNSNVTPLVPKDKNDKEESSLVSSLSPREIVSELDRFVVGQNKAKKAVAVALRNRWRRQALEGEMKNEVLPKNILMIGPTGVGKTEISRRLSKLAEAPFVKVEATRFTEVGYVGRDVEQTVSYTHLTLPTILLV